MARTSQPRRRSAQPLLLLLLLLLAAMVSIMSHIEQPRDDDVRVVGHHRPDDKRDLREDRALPRGRRNPPVPASSSEGSRAGAPALRRAAASAAARVQPAGGQEAHAAVPPFASEPGDPPPSATTTATTAAAATAAPSARVGHRRLCRDGWEASHAGTWNESRWLPARCRWDGYSREEQQRALQSFSKVVVMGDSQMSKVARALR